MNPCDYFFVATWKIRKDSRETVYVPCWINFTLLIISVTYFGLDWVSYRHSGEVPSEPAVTDYNGRWSVYLDTYCTSSSPTLTHERRQFDLDFDTCEQQCFDAAKCKVFSYGLWTGGGENRNDYVCSFYERCAAKSWTGMKVYAANGEELLAPIPEIDIRMLAPVPLNFIAMGAKPLVGVCTVCVGLWAIFVGLRYGGQDVIHSLQIALVVANAVFLIVMYAKIREKLMNAASRNEAPKVDPTTYIPPQVQYQAAPAKAAARYGNQQPVAPYANQQPAVSKPTNYTAQVTPPSYTLLDFPDPVPAQAPQKKSPYQNSLGEFGLPSVTEGKPAPAQSASPPSYAFSDLLEEKERAAPSGPAAAPSSSPPSYAFQDYLEEKKPVIANRFEPNRVSYHSSAQSEPPMGMSSGTGAPLKHGQTTLGGYDLSGFLPEGEDEVRAKTTPAPVAAGPKEQDGMFVFDLSALRRDSNSGNSGN